MAATVTLGACVALWNDPGSVVASRRAAASTPTVYGRPWPCGRGHGPLLRNAGHPRVGAGHARDR